MKKLSLIIPCRGDVPVPSAMAALSRLSYPEEDLEIVLVPGRQPSRQRNEGARAAKGDILCFLDDDSIPPSGYLKEAVSGIPWDDPATAGGGGPCLLRPKDAASKLFSAAVSAFFVHCGMRARYKGVGRLRPSGEKELIGCNLLVKRGVFLELGGFSEALYPNEENELLNRMNRAGYKTWYDPRLTVTKEVGWPLPEFLRKFFRYGKGRGKQVFFDPLSASLLYFVPPAFLCYVVGLAFVPSAPYRLPIAVYACCALAESAAIAVRRRNAMFLLLPAVFLMIHLVYGAGMLMSIVSRPFMRHRDTAGGVEVRKMKCFDACVERQVIA